MDRLKPKMKMIQTGLSHFILVGFVLRILNQEYPDLASLSSVRDTVTSRHYIPTEQLGYSESLTIAIELSPVLMLRCVVLNLYHNVSCRS